MSSVRYLETSVPVARAIQRAQLAVEVGSNSPRFEFGLRFPALTGAGEDPRHPVAVHSVAKTSAPGPGQYEVVNPEVTKMATSPRTQWGDRGVWADVDHVELTKQKLGAYGRYTTAGARRALAEMSMSRAQSHVMSRGAGGSSAGKNGGSVASGGSGYLSRDVSRMSSRSSQLFTDPTQLATLAAASVVGGAEGASRPDGDGTRRHAGAAGETRRQSNPTRLAHPGDTVYNLPPLNHGPAGVFAPTCSAAANRLFIQCLTPAKRFAATPSTKHRPLSDYPDPGMRQRYAHTGQSVRADTISESMRKTKHVVHFQVPDAGSTEDKRGPVKVYREVVLKPHRTGPVKRDLHVRL